MADGNSDMSRQKNSRSILELSSSESLASPTPDTHTVATPASTSGRWTETEKALLLNYPDECLRDKKNLKQTIEQRLHDHSGRGLTYHGIKERLRTLLLACNQKATAQEVLENGTACLELRGFPKDFLSVVKLQRLYWGLDELNMRDTDPAPDATVGREIAQTNVSKCPPYFERSTDFEG